MRVYGWTRDNGASEPWNLDIQRAVHLNFDLRRWVIGVETYRDGAGRVIIISLGPLSLDIFYS